MRIGVVISTLGKSDSTGMLLESLHSQSFQPTQVVIVDQSDNGAMAELVAEWQGRLPISRRFYWA